MLLFCSHVAEFLRMIITQYMLLYLSYCINIHWCSSFALKWFNYWILPVGFICLYVNDVRTYLQLINVTVYT